MREIYRSKKEQIKTTLEPLRPVYEGWMRLIVGFNWLLARVVLTVIFFTVFLVYGVILRVLKKDPLSRKLDDDASSYWTDNVGENEDYSDFEKQY